MTPTPTPSLPPAPPHANSKRRVVVAVVSLVILLWVAAAGFVLYRPALDYLHDSTGLGSARPGEHWLPTDVGPGGSQAGPPRVLGDPRTSGTGAWPGLFDATPKAFDFDGDGVDEIILFSNDTKVYVFDAGSGRALATLPSTYPPGWYVERVLNAVEAARMGPGEEPSIVVTDHAAFVTLWRYVPGRSDATHFEFERIWEHRMDTCFWNPGMDAKPTLADLDGDGTLEILVQTEELGFFALGANGTTLWHRCWPGGNSAPIVGDLEDDGSLEVVVASDSGQLSVFNGRTGNTIWTFDAANDQYGIHPASVSASPVIADIDGRMPKEVLFTARQAPVDDPELYSTFHMAILAVHRNPTTYKGELVWMRQPEWAHPLSQTQLLVEDVDGDGSADIFGMDWNTIGHIPGNWDLLGYAHAFRLDASGRDVWVQEIDSWWSNKEILLLDANQDGTKELFVNGADAGSDGLVRLELSDGDPSGFLPADRWKLMRNAAFLDLWHDGVPEFVCPASPDEPDSKQGAILLYEFSSPTPNTA